MQVAYGLFALMTEKLDSTIACQSTLFIVNTAERTTYLASLQLEEHICVADAGSKLHSAEPPSGM
jgi:hypothetical protein